MFDIFSHGVVLQKKKKTYINLFLFLEGFTVRASKGYKILIDV
jgi:hypothetical protein